MKNILKNGNEVNGCVLHSSHFTNTCNQKKNVLLGEIIRCRMKTLRSVLKVAVNHNMSYHFKDDPTKPVIHIYFSKES